MKRIRRVWERVGNVPGLGRDVVAVLLLVAVSLASTGYIFSQYGWRLPWDEPVLVAAVFEKTPGVRPESRQEVRIAGVSIGKIESAKPQPDGNVRVVMSLEDGHTVYSNAQAVLRTKTPINAMYIALDPGGSPGKALPQGGTIPVSRTKRLIEPWEALNKLDERTRHAVTSLINQADAALASAPQHLPGGLRATHATMATYRPVLEQLQTRRQNIAQLVTSLARISAAVGKDDKRLARLASSLQQTLAVLGKRDDQLADTLAQVPGFNKALRQAMTSTSTLTTQLDPVLGSLHGASEQLPSALSRLTDTVENAGKLVDRATPVVAKAKPVVADLRPLAGDVNAALGDLAPVTGDLPSATKRIVPWMNDLAAFVYHTSSAASMADVNGGLARANLSLMVTDPSGGGIVPDLTGIGKAGN